MGLDRRIGYDVHDCNKVRKQLKELQNINADLRLQLEEKNREIIILSTEVNTILRKQSLQVDAINILQHIGPLYRGTDNISKLDPLLDYLVSPYLVEDKDGYS